MGAPAGPAGLDLSAPPPQLEYKAAGPSGVLLDHDDTTGIVECLVSITGIVDDQRDVILPGAYADTLATRYEGIATRIVCYFAGMDWQRDAASLGPWGELARTLASR